MICAEPGMMPITKPSTEPRAIGKPDWRHSLRVGHSSRRRGRVTLLDTVRLGVARISPSPNSPTATGTMPMPSPSSGMSKLKRKCPLITSMPMVPSNKPNEAISNVRGNELVDI